MSIDVTCPHCQNRREFTDDYAGRKLLCGQCKNIYEVPVPGGTHDTTTLPPPDIALPRTENHEPLIRSEHLTAGRICFVIGVFCVIFGLLFGAGALLLGTTTPTAAKTVAARDVATTIFGGVALAMFLMAALYFCCGSNIRAGGMISARIMLVFTGLQLAGLLFRVAMLVLEVTNAPAGKGVQPAAYGAIGGVVIGLLIHGKLLACLMSICGGGPVRRAPRPAMA